MAAWKHCNAHAALPYQIVERHSMGGEGVSWETFQRCYTIQGLPGAIEPRDLLVVRSESFERTPKPYTAL